MDGEVQCEIQIAKQIDIRNPRCNTNNNMPIKNVCVYINIPIFKRRNITPLSLSHSFALGQFYNCN